MNEYKDYTIDPCDVGTLTIYNKNWDGVGLDEINIDLSPAQIAVICEVLGFGPASDDGGMELKMWHDNKLKLMIQNDIGAIAHLISRRGYDVIISNDNETITMKRKGVSKNV